VLAIFALFSARHAYAAIMSPPPPTPEDGDAFDLYVGDQETYDSNLYRLPSNLGTIANSVSPNASRVDYINSATLGGDGQWQLGRQTVDLYLRADENRFAHNDSLNNTSGDGKLLWNWLVGSLLSGEVGAEYNRALASFAETLYLGRDLVDTTKYFGSGRFQLGPHWAVFGDIFDTHFTHSAAAAKFNDFRAISGDGGIEYATNVDDVFQLQYGYTSGSYPQDFVFDNALLNRNYHEYTTQFKVKYAVTDKTTINGYAGYLKRDYVEAKVGRFSGDIWRVSVDWRPTDKTDLVATGWHELHAYTVSEADYFVSHGASLSPVWNASEKITFSLVFSLEDQNFIASSTSALLTGSRTDKVTGQQINLLYTPRSNLFLNVFFRNEQRSSPVEEFNYNDKMARGSVTWKFR
jgi:hypothetical protein